MQRLVTMAGLATVPLPWTCSENGLVSAYREIRGKGPAIAAPGPAIQHAMSVLK